MKKLTARIMILLVCLMTFFSSGLSLSAEEAGSKTETIHSTFYVLTTKENHTIEVPFNADWFKQDARIFSHDLAKLSIGLATAAFRPSAADKDHSLADINLRKFLAEARFTDLRSDDYEKNPSMYTVSTVMGHRRIGSGDEAFDLIAVGICGQGYLDEWESNFSIGSGKIHAGFDRSARLVYDRIFGYIQSADIQGPCKIWISGFSRAAAITNITAARLTESKTFSQKDVFAYSFATPRTVIDPLYMRYENIFSIVGKADPVPNVPFADWGYERYGKTLYLPALETDSDFEKKRERANVVYKELTGIDYWYNRDANELARDILGYFLEICPTSDVYARSLQNRLVHLWEDRSPINIMSNLLDMANDPVLINEKTMSEANMLLNYLLGFVFDYMDSANMFSRWNKSASLGANVLQSHTPELYISWLYSSDDGEGLYNEATAYTTVVVESPYEVTLSRGGEVIESLQAAVDNSGKEKVVLIPKKERYVPFDYQYMSYSEDNIMITVPRDEDYTIAMKSSEAKPVEVFIAEYDAGNQIAESAQIINYELQEEDGIYIVLDQDGITSVNTVKPLNEEKYELSDYSLPVSSISTMVRPKTASMSWRDAALWVIRILVILICLILFFIAYMIGRIRFNHRVKLGWIPEGTKYRSLPMLTVFAIFVQFFVMIFFMQLFPENQSFVFFNKLIIACLSCLNALMGYLHRRTWLSGLIVIGLALLGIADSFTSLSIGTGTLLHIAAYAFLTFAYYKEAKPGWKQVFAWSIMSAIAIAWAANIDGSYGYLRVLAIIYMVVALAMVVTSILMPRRVFFGSQLLILSGILLINNQVNGTTFISHMISLGIYYMAITMLATANTRIILRSLVQESPPDLLSGDPS